jgi:hypothetical protein
MADTGKLIKDGKELCTITYGTEGDKGSLIAMGGSADYLIETDEYQIRTREGQCIDISVTKAVFQEGRSSSAEFLVTSESHDC